MSSIAYKYRPNVNSSGFLYFYVQYSAAQWRIQELVAGGLSTLSLHPRSSLFCPFLSSIQGR